MQFQTYVAYLTMEVIFFRSLWYINTIIYYPAHFALIAVVDLLSRVIIIELTNTAEIASKHYVAIHAVL